MEVVGNEGMVPVLPASACASGEQNSRVRKSVMRRRGPACAQLSRKLKQSFIFAADYFDVKGVSAGRGCFRMYLCCFSHQFTHAELTRPQLKNPKRT